MMLGQEPRQTTSNLGALNKPSIQVSAWQDIPACESVAAASNEQARELACTSFGGQAVTSRQLFSTQQVELSRSLSVVSVCIQALIHGLNRHYYSIGINYRCARV
jgi:hypothetical protein